MYYLIKTCTANWAIRLYLPLLLTSVLLIACSNTNKSVCNSTNKKHTSENTSDANQIISLVFTVTKPSPHIKDSVLLAKCVISLGLLKNDISIAPTIPASKWRCSLLDENYTVLKSTIEDDPLIRNHEYVDEINGEMVLGYKTVCLQQGSFMVRARYTENMKYILLEKSDSLANPYTDQLFSVCKKN